MTPTKKQLEEYRKYLEKEGKKLNLTSEDLGNLYDMMNMLDEDTYQTFKLNKIYKWFNQFFEKIERIVIPELYNKKVKGGKK